MLGPSLSLMHDERRKEGSKGINRDSAASHFHILTYKCNDKFSKLIRKISPT